MMLPFTLVTAIAVLTGPAAVPVLQPLLSDETRRDQHPAILESLVRAAGPDAIPVLERLLRDEKTFWNNLGMNLEEPAKLPPGRADQLASILHQLAVLGYLDIHGLDRDAHDQYTDHAILRH